MRASPARTSGPGWVTARPPTGGRSSTVPRRCGTRSINVASRSPVAPHTSHTVRVSDQSRAADRAKACTQPPAAIAWSNSAHARHPPGWSTRNNAVTRFGRTRPRRSKLTPPPGGSESKQPLEHDAVNIELGGKGINAHAAAQRLRHPGFTRCHQHPMVEHPEQSLQNPGWRWSHGCVDCVAAHS